MSSIKEEILEELEEYIGEDTLSKETLFNNIKNSSGSNYDLARIFDVSVDLVKRIKSSGE